MGQKYQFMNSSSRAWDPLLQTGLPRKSVGEKYSFSRRAGAEPSVSFFLLVIYSSQLSQLKRTPSCQTQPLSHRCFGNRKYLSGLCQRPGSPCLGELLSGDQNGVTRVLCAPTLSCNAVTPLTSKMWSNICPRLWRIRLKALFSPLGGGSKNEKENRVYFPTEKKKKKKKSRAEILKQEIYRRSSDFELDFQGSIFVFFLLIP